jgi:FkbM family methyltransferase
MVYAFEPLPDNIVLIKRNFKNSGYKGLFLSEVCLSDSVSFATFNVSSREPDSVKLSDYTELSYWHKSSSLLAPGAIEDHYIWLEFEKKIQVSTTTLDLYCKEKNVSYIDFIHMDVQGAELMVLIGASAHMNSIDIIWMEVSSVDIYKDQPLKREVNDYMKSFGYFKALDIGDYVTGDELWIRKAYMDSLPQETQRVLKSEHVKSSISFRINSIISSSRKYLSKKKADSRELYEVGIKSTQLFNITLEILRNLIPQYVVSLLSSLRTHARTKANLLASN